MYVLRRCVAAEEGIESSSVDLFKEVYCARASAITSLVCTASSRAISSRVRCARLKSSFVCVAVAVADKVLVCGASFLLFTAKKPPKPCRKRSLIAIILRHQNLENGKASNNSCGIPKRPNLWEGLAPVGVSFTTILHSHTS